MSAVYKDDLESLMEKLSLNSDSKDEIRKCFERSIVQVFYSKNNINGTKTETEAKVTKKVEKKEDTADDTICKETKKDGNRCTFKAKENGYCGRHAKNANGTTASAKKTSTKKTAAHLCNGVVKTSGEDKKCSSSGTIKPDGADNYYCKKHSTKWKAYEGKETEVEVVDDSDAEDPKEEPKQKPKVVKQEPDSGSESDSALSIND
jgi:hypothetical protein